jgi:glycosyltransferase involved in cell wall biosynthesis
MSPPILTVVIPTLDEVSTIGRCLDAIGTDACVEVVVSDGGSTDGTVDVVRTNGRAHLLRGPAGRGQQLRRGAAAATAARLPFLHADCRLPRGWLPAVVEALEGESLGGELRARLEASVGAAGRAARP